MKEGKSISVYAVNATVYKDVTPTGKDKYIIKLNSNAGDAVDRVQSCHDYELPLSFTLITGARVFKNDYKYITFAMYPKDSNSNYLVTCRCAHQELSQDKALELIEKGMAQAISELNS
ncbi:MAG: hypothetical protein ABJH06_07120 [Paraglaciecola sp.]|uniref:hypothetical protein n=1 Tax=Paraglaciecola sp. TaxID=1920173 RepID=UPI0032634471